MSDEVATEGIVLASCPGCGVGRVPASFATTFHSSLQGGASRRWRTP